MVFLVMEDQNGLVSRIVEGVHNIANVLQTPEIETMANAAEIELYITEHLFKKEIDGKQYQHIGFSMGDNIIYTYKMISE